MARIKNECIAKLIALLFYHLAAVIASEEIQPKREFDFEYRLPDNLVPIVYDLKLTFASNSDEIIGQVRKGFSALTNDKAADVS